MNNRSIRVVVHGHKRIVTHGDIGIVSRCRPGSGMGIGIRTVVNVGGIRVVISGEEGVMTAGNIRFVGTR